jgi:CubicO group peptidase (beta-lactamase class C family)
LAAAPAPAGARPSAGSQTPIASCQLVTIFDLASLTKVIATTSIAMQQIVGHLALDTRLDLVADWAIGDRQLVTIRHLLDHSSGLPARVLAWQQVDRARHASG